MLVSNMTVGGFDLRQNKDNKFDICCFMAEHGALTSKSKHCLAAGRTMCQSEWSNMSTRTLTTENPAKRVVLV